MPEAKRKALEFPDIAAMDGYGANYLDLKRGDIIPLLGHLFYVEGEAELRRLEPAHAAYKQLGFPVEGTFSFPYHGDVVREYYEAVSGEKEGRGTAAPARYPDWAYNAFRGNKVVVRKVRRRSDGEKDILEVEVAVVPLALDGYAVGLWPKADDFHWSSVGDELRIPWAFVARGGEAYSAGKHVETTTTDPRYYRITNIVLPNSPTIQVQPDDGGAPIECRPIGWVDIDIHGRKEPEKKAGSP